MRRPKVYVFEPSTPPKLPGFVARVTRVTTLPKTLRQGDILVAFGGAALGALHTVGWIPKNHKTLASARERAWPVGKGHVFVSHNPENVFDPNVPRQQKWDLNLISRMIHSGTTQPLLGDYVWKPSLGFLVNRIKAKADLFGRPVRLAWDLETMGRWPWARPDKEIIASGWSIRPGRSYCVHHYQQPPSKTLLREMEWLLTAPEVRLIGANIKFDCHWAMEKWGIFPRPWFDILIAGSLLDENRHNSLKWLTKELIPDLGGYSDLFDRQYDKGRMELIPKEEILQYLGADADATLRVADVLLKQLTKQPTLANFYAQVSHPASIALTDIEQVGEYVDAKHFKRFARTLRKEIRQHQHKIVRMLSPRVRAHLANQKNPSPFTKAGEVKANVIREQLFSERGFNVAVNKHHLTAKTKVAGTSLKILKVYFKHKRAKPFIEALRPLSKATAMHSRYAKAWPKFIHPDGKFHSNYMLYVGAMFADRKEETSGATTGRLSAKEPPRQTATKRGVHAKRLRENFPAPPGYDCFQLDYKTGELCLVADRARDPVMIEAIKKGTDLHALTASEIRGVPLEEFVERKTTDTESYEWDRYCAKAVNFGFVFGQQAAGFVDYAFQNYDLDLTFEQGEDYRTRYMNLYRRVPQWHREEVRRARKALGVESPMGRFRHLPAINSKLYPLRSRAERQAINAPIQATLSDMNLLALALWYRANGPIWTPRGIRKLPLYPIGLTHDSTNGYVEKSRKGLDALLELRDLMMHLPVKKLFSWSPRVPFGVDIELGPNLGALKGIKDEKEALKVLTTVLD